MGEIWFLIFHSSFSRMKCPVLYLNTG